MTTYLLWIVAASGMLIIYHHAVYPLLLKWLAKRTQAKSLMVQQRGFLPSSNDDHLPEITLIVPVFNEAEVIADKLRNIALLDYPNDKLYVQIYDDGSTDNTLELARQVIDEPELAGYRITLIPARTNRGKVALLNQAITAVKTELVLLSDASALISSDSLLIIAAHMKDPQIGVVAGTYRLLQPGSEGEAAYWEYQTKIKEMESRTGSTIGVHGALYCLRPHLFRPLPADTINDDFIISMDIVAQGYRCVYEPTIVAVELEQASLELDQARRRRIAAGNMQQILRLMPLLHPRLGVTAFNFISGKFLRVWMPLLLLTFLGCSIALSFYYPLATAFVAGQIVVYSLAAWRQLNPDSPAPRFVKLIHYLVSGHVANGIGSVRYLSGKEKGHWQRAKIAATLYSARGYVPLTVRQAKRAIDIVFSLIALVITLPLWPLIAVAIKVSSPGPIFFRQFRIGCTLPDKTDLFMMIKFRTMVADAEKASGAIWATSNDPRITKVGNFLRKTRLDELPQLINVLRGDMSLVGPRPERPGISRNLDQSIPFYIERTYGVCPGITGLAQINQGYDRCLEDVKNKLAYDHAYALSLSHLGDWIRMDVEVMFKTFWVMVMGRGQ